MYYTLIRTWTNNINSSLVYKHLSNVPENSDQLLFEFHRFWEKKKIFLRWLTKIFTPIDEYLAHPGRSLCCSGFNVFLDECFAKHAERVVRWISKLINQERDGELVPSFQIKKAISVIT